MRIDLKASRQAPSHPAAELLRREIERRRPRSLEEANRIAAEVCERYNRTPQEELGGLSPMQVHALTSDDWMDRALSLNANLEVEDLAAAPLLQNARRVLAVLDELGGAKATATGAFNRKIAARMFEEFTIEEDKREFLRKYHKVFNQGDVPYLELLRHLLPQAGLLLYRKGEFRLTKRARALLAPASTGELYRLIFRTLFTRFNLAAMDRLPAAPQVQRFIGFALYQMGVRASGSR